tara:strand:- start:5746 stop:6096 length:351 start_codon:yes stop_codon:yes gene_type:complete
MYLVDDVPLVIGHVGKSLVAENTSVVDEDVNAAILLNRRLDNRLAVLHISLVANSLATKLLDFLHNVVRVDKIVNDDLRAALSQLQAVDATESSTSTGDERNLACEVKLLALGVCW